MIPSKYEYATFLSNYWLLWYKKSHSFSVVDSNFKEVLDIYFRHNTITDFTTSLIEHGFEEPRTQIILKDIENYLVNSLFTEDEKFNSHPSLNINERAISYHYRFRGFTFTLYFNSKSIVPFFHKALAHLQLLEQPDTTHFSFDFQLTEDNLALFLDQTLIQCVPKSDIHKIQGKFNFCLMNKIYSKSETDWIATLHGCTIAKNDKSIMLVGHSGNGKSTCSAILASHGYELVTDDISSLAADELSIYNNPSAISLKSGSFKWVSKYFKALASIDPVELNSEKGQLKFLPLPFTTKTNYQCRAIVLVKYAAGETISFIPATLAEILEPLIPDSWISSKEVHAIAFMNWLKMQKLYKLTYSNHKDMIQQIDNLFEIL